MQKRKTKKKTAPYRPLWDWLDEMEGRKAGSSMVAFNKEIEKINASFDMSIKKIGASK